MNAHKSTLHLSALKFALQIRREMEVSVVQIEVNYRETFKMAVDRCVRYAQLLRPLSESIKFSCNQRSIDECTGFRVQIAITLALSVKT